MIEFPSLNNYISDYNNPKSKSYIVISYKPKNPNLTQYSKRRYFCVNNPFGSQILVDTLNNLFKQRNIEVKAEIYPESNGFEEINIWQLMWFVNNITEIKKVRVTIHTDNPNYDDDETVTINLSNPKDIKMLLTKLDEYSS